MSLIAGNRLIVITIIISFSSLKVSAFKNSTYSRELVQKKYPGFGTDWIPIEQDNGRTKIGYFKLKPPKSRIGLSLTQSPEEVVTFTFYSRKNTNGTQVQSPTQVVNFDPKKPTKFVTHGWMSSGTADTCILIKNGFLKKYDANVFVMDWGKISGNIFYPIPMAATWSVGRFYAKFLDDLISKSKVNPKDVHMVGHSLGAHVSGFAARGLNIGRVTGLDPALPGFVDPSIVEGVRLNKTDADFVDVIHTCAGFLGFEESLGHADFFPNGGWPPQPGCGSILSEIEACSHGRSWLYFSASLTSEAPFMGYRCDSFRTHRDYSACSRNDSIPMGDPTPTTARGDYYLTTDPMPPYVVISNNDDVV